MTEKLKEEYIDNGVYVGINSFDIAIYTQREGQHHCIWLDRDMLLHVLEFANELGWEMPKS